MNESLQIYAKHRDLLLQAIVENLSTDERFVAAWLTGSFAREEQDALSDIDITLVVDDKSSQVLCSRPKIVSAQTTKERYELFCLFGQPAFLHENNHNAPEGGTFTFVAYDQNSNMVDWILRPLTGAQRPQTARLLFDKVGIPVQKPPEPESQEERAHEASQIMAFFWMMTAVNVKYVYRGDGVSVNTWLEELAKLVPEVERRISGDRGEAWQYGQYKRGSLMQLKTTPNEQIAAIRQLCRQMEDLKEDLVEFGGHVPEAPMTVIETLIRIVQEKYEFDNIS